MTVSKRRYYQLLKSLTHERFWQEMDTMHSRAYELAVKHYTEAGEITLTPKQREKLHAKAKEICEKWDGIGRLEVDI
jgi:Zn-dependent oligopeptidase